MAVGCGRRLDHGRRCRLLGHVHADSGRGARRDGDGRRLDALPASDATTDLLDQVVAEQRTGVGDVEPAAVRRRRVVAERVGRMPSRAMAAAITERVGRRDREPQVVHQHRGDRVVLHAGEARAPTSTDRSASSASATVAPVGQDHGQLRGQPLQVGGIEHRRARCRSAWCDDRPLPGPAASRNATTSAPGVGWMAMTTRRRTISPSWSPPGGRCRRRSGLGAASGGQGGARRRWSRRRRPGVARC